MEGIAGGSTSCRPGCTRYLVRSSDVLEDMRINVHEEGSGKVVWYKERFLTDDEILEHIVDNATSTLLWTVHRPKRGWYIRLRTPSFPPGVFIPLLPLPQTSPYHTEAALSFACRTNLPASSGATPPNGRPTLTKHSTDSDVTLTESLTREQHSYPPTPPTGPVVLVQPPSPRSVHAKLNSASTSPPRALRRHSQPLLQQSAITHFVLTPHSTPHIPETTLPLSILSKLLAVIKNNAPGSHSYSFTLSPIPGSPKSSAGPEVLPAPAGQTGNPLSPTPLLTFHDQTPVWTARCTSGLIEMDEQQCRVLGVEPAFYIAAALTYLEFLEDRESYLAAASD
ncbi:hypothetical protein C8Q80DRAFT_912107 [Daedaleopsis nitida]|nr:hypothetical protein C8Q80DRAFT_912107 [Daedaleopsis nitida]